MITESCPVCTTCGKEIDMPYPSMWRFKRGSRYFCRWSCMRKYDKQREKGAKEAMEEQKTRKKPGPKPKVELVYDESIAEEYRREQEAKKAEEHIKVIPLVDDFEVIGIRNSLGTFIFDHAHGTIDWTESATKTEVSLLPDEWERLAEVIPLMLKKLGAGNGMG